MRLPQARGHVPGPGWGREGGKGSEVGMEEGAQGESAAGQVWGAWSAGKSRPWAALVPRVDRGLGSALLAPEFQAGKWSSSATGPRFWALSALTAGPPTS